MILQTTEHYFAGFCTIAPLLYGIVIFAIGRLIPVQKPIATGFLFFFLHFLFPMSDLVSH